MSIDPTLLEGLRAYGQRDFEAASKSWQAVHDGCEEALSSRRGSWADCALAEALASLAAALDAQGKRRHEAARVSFETCVETLQTLPRATLGVDVGRLTTQLPETASQALSAPPEIAAARRLPKRVVVRFLVFVALVAVTFLVLRATPAREYLSPESLAATLDELRHSWWAPVALILLYVILCPLGTPITPLVLAGGAIFGTLAGGLVNFIGAVLGAVVSFFFARGLAHDLVAHMLGSHQKRIERFLRNQGFWTLVRLRFVPIPYPLANFGVALAGVPFGLFLGSTALALVPLMLVESYLASSFVHAAEGQRAEHLYQLLAAMALFLGLSFLPTQWIAWQRRRRYSRLMELRRKRRPIHRQPGTSTARAG